MNIFTTIFNEVLYRPLLNVLVALYNILPGNDLGVAIIILTILMRLVFYPLSQKAVEAQKSLSLLQPKIKEIQKKYPDKQEQAQKMMALYQEHKVNPMAGCLPILIQFPVLLALYRVFWKGLAAQELSMLYSFVKNPGALNPYFFGLVNLAVPSAVLAIVAGAVQFIHSKLSIKGVKNVDKKKGSFDISTMMGAQMTYFLPFISIIIAWRLPAGLPLYWIFSTLFGIGQQLIAGRKAKQDVKT